MEFSRPPAVGLTELTRQESRGFPPIRQKKANGWGTGWLLLVEIGAIGFVVSHPFAMKLRMDGAPGTRQN